ncbi:uncharacterized protein [Typha latifolia]|uniref:uncharacterized protein n=1 Tax=Typha latifolia TaxID=4733 RepID=UPI003C301A98
MKRFRLGGEQVEGENTITMANVLVLLSRGGGGDDVINGVEGSPQSLHGRVFECKTCNRQFPSFQALGGHRASHKKPRIASEGPAAGVGKPRVHECSVCGLEFAIGQALGGHMRRHRAAVEGFGHGGAAAAKKKVEERRVVCLDLNLTPSENDDLKIGGLAWITACR